ncbi:hypothetical protein [Pseudogulbenkiania ferrooxidans]|uniref:Shikimate kinase n=1 Tax=Pseudogulbenkiania ferrooxidans 2002 TaxID=279714 RepID=B9Z4X2_9NEIS|nr:hypothetical protein [Pseudogulbenkiania ferrooxidans]EEG08204.1 hypothetical protein FuraDRAFT_2407 [Pseudogulbenkiania ferrooxidans 2002]
MAKPRNLWPDAMDVWLITGAMATGKTRLGSTLLEIARQHGLSAEMVDGVQQAGQIDSLLKMRTSSPDMLIVVADADAGPLQLPKHPVHVLHLNPGDADRVEQLAAQVWARRQPSTVGKEARHA